MDFLYLLRTLMKRKWIIIFATIIGAGIAYLFTRDDKKNYRSVAQISTGFTVSDEIKVDKESFDFYEAETKFNNVITTAYSPGVISLLSYNLILHDLENSIPFRRLTEEQKKTDAFKRINKERAKEVFRDKLETMTMLTSFKEDERKLLEFLRLYKYDYNNIINTLSIYRVQRTDYLQIEYISENPELSAFIVNTEFQQFIRYYKNIRSTKSQESIDTLKSIMEKRKQELDIKNALLRGEPADINLENTSRLDLISNLEQTLTSEKTKLTQLYSSLQKVNQKLKDAGSTPKISVENDELLTLRKAMNDAYAAYLNTGSTDKNLLNEYNLRKAEYQKKLSSVNPPEKGSNADVTKLIQDKNDLEIDIQASNVTINSIQSNINRLKGNVVQDASKGATAQTLMKEAEQANKEYLDAKQKYIDALDLSTSAVNNFKQVLVGQPAISPEPSKRKIIVAFAGMAAMVTTILVIILLVYLDSSIKTPVIFSKTVKLKLISMVNFMNLKNKPLAGIVTNAEGVYTPTDKNRQNVFRESLRKLRYEIEHSGKKIFLFTSTKKGQGKTTLIQALSYSMSLSKKKILIIDTNFCNNDLTVQLNAEPALEKIVPFERNNSFLVEQVKQVSKDVGAGTVFIIGCEGGDYTPSEILPKENLLHRLHELTPEYDYIFLEGPPLNDYSDSKELSKFVDGVIAIFSANHIIKQIDKESIKFFHELDGKFCGAVLNMVDLKNVNVS